MLPDRTAPTVAPATIGRITMIAVVSGGQRGSSGTTSANVTSPTITTCAAPQYAMAAAVR
jgi:hypothetical protein